MDCVIDVCVDREVHCFDVFIVDDVVILEVAYDADDPADDPIDNPDGLVDDLVIVVDDDVCDVSICVDVDVR